MKIWIDPTEKSSGTRLPAAVIDIAISLPGLEAATGADMMISWDTDDRTLKSLTHEHALELAGFVAFKSFISPVDLRKKFEKEFDLDVSIVDCINWQNFGKILKTSVLVQRKSGRDLINSFEDLDNILSRMKRCTDYPILLYTGDYKRNHQGDTVLNGKTFQEARWSYQNITSNYLMRWQLNGGVVAHVLRDNLIKEWIEGLVRMLKKAQEQPVKSIFPPKRVPLQDLRDVDRAKEILVAIPKIGEKRAMKLWEASAGSVADCLVVLTEPNALEDFKELLSDLRIGKKTLKTIRDAIMGENHSLSHKLTIISEDNDEEKDY